MKNIITLLTLLVLSFLLFIPQFNYAQTATEKHLVKCIKKLDKKIKRTPDNSALYVQRSLCIVKLSASSPERTWVDLHISDAFNDINKAIQLDSANASLYSIRAGLKRDFNFDFTGAIDDIKTAMAIEPYSNRWHDEMAAYQKLLLHKSYYLESKENAQPYRIAFE